jgi:hypothetical protein
MLVFRAASTAVRELLERQSSPKSRSAQSGSRRRAHLARRGVAAQVGVPALVECIGNASRVGFSRRLDAEAALHRHIVRCG